MRVAMLLPVIVFATALNRRSGPGQDMGKRPPVLPGFAVGFAVLVGMKTQLKEVISVGLKPVLLMIGETVFLAALVLAMLRWWH